jgi:transcriptional regulator with XRE-family HTH domain
MGVNMTEESAKKVSGIGLRIQKYRVIDGMSALELANKLRETFGEGTPSRQFISKIESGVKHDITVTQLMQFAFVLGISPTALVCDVEQPFKVADTPAFGNAFNSDIYTWFSVEENSRTKYPEEGFGFKHGKASERIRMIQFYLRTISKAQEMADKAYKLYQRAMADANMEKDIDRATAINSQVQYHLENYNIAVDSVKQNAETLRNEYGLFLPVMRYES